MRSFVLLVPAALAACQPVAKPPSSSPEPLAERAPRTDTFVRTYERQVGDIRRQLEQRGLTAEWAAVRRKVDQYLAASHYTLQATGADAAMLHRLRVDSTTNSLLLYGYRSVHLVNAEQARLIVQAADLSSPSSSADLAILAPTVLVANMEGVRDAGDGSTQLVYRVIEPLKNAPPKEAILSLTLSGPRAASPYPPPPQPGEEELRSPGMVVLTLSPPRPVAEGPAAHDAYARVGQLRIEGEKVLPSYHSGAPETTLASLREAIRKQVCAPGYVPVGAMPGQSVAC